MPNERLAAKIVQSGQEQAVASWVQLLNQLRVDQLVAMLGQQEVHLRDALASIDEATGEIEKIIANNRGGTKGMHGFIAEIAQVGVGNARNQVEGGAKTYAWVDDNGPADLLHNGIQIQQKFHLSGGKFGLNAIAEHLEKYPEFVVGPYKYQIPKDHYETVRELYFMSREEASRVLSNTGDGPSFKQWVSVQKFFADKSVTFESLEPSFLKYSEVQKGAYEATLTAEKNSLAETDQALRVAAEIEHRPSLKQGAQATVAAAAVEGTTAFVMAVVQRRRAGTALKDFSREDWADISRETGLGTVRGGVRGLFLYSLTNFTATGAAVASALVTAAFGVAEQANKLRRGEITEQVFIENAEIVSLEAAVSALSSFIGQATIPIPILGAVIGNTVGTVMYKTVSDALSAREAHLIEHYVAAQLQLDEKLAAEFQELLEQLDEAIAEYVTLLEVAFSPDVLVALEGSISLAHELGVDADEILDTKEKTAEFFLG